MQDIGIFFQVAVLVMSVVIHEVSHGTMALALGDPTAKLLGRLTLNPVKHIDPVGSILIPAVMALSNTGFIFGWAKPVPYNPYNLRDQRYGDAKVALAGPLSNLLIALIFGLMLRFFSGFIPPSAIELIVLIIQMNLVLAIFNLLPIPPLDGSKVLFGSLPYRYRYYLNIMEQYQIVAILLVVFVIWPLIQPFISILFKLIVGIA